MSELKNKLQSKIYLVVVLLAFITVGFHIYLIFTGLLPNLVTRPMHLALVLPWVFLFGNDKDVSKGVKYFGYILLVLALLSSFYILFNHSNLEDQYGSLEGPLQYFVAITLILSVLEMARRAIKLALPLTALIALAYGLF